MAINTGPDDMLELGLITSEVDQTLRPDLMSRLQELSGNPSG
jgi:hypothetical protein